MPKSNNTFESMFKKRRFKVRRSGNSSVATSNSSKGSYTSYNTTTNTTSNNIEYDVASPTPSSSLANFDACVEACDAIAASSGSSMSGWVGSPTSKKKQMSSGSRSNNSDGNSCSGDPTATVEHECSAMRGGQTIMISPDGELLSCSNHGHYLDQHESETVAADADHNNDIIRDGVDLLEASNEQELIDEDDHQAPEASHESGLSAEERVRHTNKGSQVSIDSSRKGDFESSIYIGNDIVPDGEKVLNGFSARGWNPIMTTMAVRRAVDTLQTTSKFVEELIISHKNSAANASQACEHLRDMMVVQDEDDKTASYFNITSPKNKSPSNHSKNNDANSMNNTSGQKSSAGPLLFPGSSLHKALLAIEHYNSKSAEYDAHRWRNASNNPSNGNGGILPSIQNSTMKNYFRAERRERALMDSQTQMAEAESNLRARKDESRKLWARVNNVEEQVNRKVEEKMRQRSRDREMRRREEESKRQAAMNDAKLPSTVTQQEIWELVAQVGKDNDGSFAPHDLPPPNVDGPLDQTLSNSRSFDSPERASQSPNLPPPTPIDDYRAQLEEDYKLHELRVAAVESDENITDAAGKLLNAISASDTTKRSARLAAETCLLSCANAQKECLKSLVALEKASLKEKMKLIEELEEKIDEVDVRSDLNVFIEHEKSAIPNGVSTLGDNDDGGIASALATLNSFSEGIGVGVGVAGMAELSSFTGWNDENEVEKIYDREDLESAVGVLFQSELYSSECSKDQEILDKLETSIKFLETAVSEKSLRGRGYRASTCYALNNFRGKNTQLESMQQYDGLCRVLNCILDGCDREAADVANAKMCMMLAQTFYLVNNDNGQDRRTNRIYPKEKLCHHLIWSDEDFWTQALFQCVTDSLANSGVMIRVRVKKSERNRKMKWHDLNIHDRADAASQIHSVIFSQLGALGHSMIEFGCSVEQACAFVRRLSVRHQLPLSQRSMLLSHLMNGASTGESGVDAK